MADSSPPPPSSSVIDGNFCAMDVDAPLSPRKCSHSPSPSVPLDTPPPLNDIFYTFLKTYQTTLHSSPSSFGRLRVFWSDDDFHPIKDKVRCAFESLEVDDSFGGLIQFWAPAKIDGRNLLTTVHQPFTLATLDKGVDKYRLCSLNYQYNVDMMDNLGVEEVSRVISNGSPTRTFLNQTPELFPDLTAHPMNPLLSSALECGLMSSVVLPVFYPSQSYCVGVVECSMSSSTQLVHVFNGLNTALEKEGFKTFDAREFLPYNTIHGLKPAKDEIDEALKIILHSYHLAFAHVWIINEDEDLSSLEDGQEKENQILGLKLTDHFFNFGDEDFGCCEKNAYYRLDRKTFQKYSDACYRFPLIMGEGKTLESYKPYFVKDISELSDTGSVLRLLSIYMHYSCFVIYLRSTWTNDLDYVFGFLWSRGRNHVILLESLLLTLKRHLPSFKIAFGTELGDEIDILDVENSRDGENEYFQILQRNKISREQIELQFGQPMKEAAKNLQVSLSTLKNMCKKQGIKWQGKDYVQSATDEKEGKGGAVQDIIGETSLDENNVTIKAEYAGDVIKFTLPISSATFADIRKEIGKNFKLDPAAYYKIKCYDEEDDEWIIFTCDEDATLFTKNKRIVQLRLLQGQISDPFHFFQLT